MTTWRRYREVFPGSAHTITGDLRLCERFPSPQLGNERNLVVYLPPSYGSGAAVYPVMYMMDGQNLFDDVLAHSSEWRVDETMEELAEEGVEAVIVAIDNGGERRTDEYSPFAVAGDSDGRAHDFVRFLTESVMPEIASRFRVSAAREDTFLFGSSLGGLLCLYAHYERPDVFGGIGVMSPSLWHGDHGIFGYLARRPVSGGRIYLDVGTRELSGRFAALVFHRRSRRFSGAARRLHLMLRDKEAHSGGRVRYVEARGAAHSETEWSRRLPAALRFLLAGEGGVHGASTTGARH